MDKKTSKTTFQKAEPIIFLGIVAIIGYAGYQVLLADQLKQFLAGGSLNTETVTQQLAERKSYYTSLSALDALYQASKKDTEKEITNLIPGQQEIPEIFASYEAIANANGVSVQSMDILNDKSVAQAGGSNVQSLVVSMKVANVSYVAIKKFLDAIETNIRLADVQSISFDPRSRFVDISIRSYYRTNRTASQ